MNEMKVGQREGRVREVGERGKLQSKAKHNGMMRIEKIYLHIPAPDIAPCTHSLSTHCVSETHIHARERGMRGG